MTLPASLRSFLNCTAIALASAILTRFRWRAVGSSKSEELFRFEVDIAVAATWPSGTVKIGTEGVLGRRPDNCTRDRILFLSLLDLLITFGTAQYGLHTQRLWVQSDPYDRTCPLSSTSSLYHHRSSRGNHTYTCRCTTNPEETHRRTPWRVIGLICQRVWIGTKVTIQDFRLLVGFLTCFVICCISPAGWIPASIRSPTNKCERAENNHWNGKTCPYSVILNYWHSSKLGV